MLISKLLIRLFLLLAAVLVVIPCIQNGMFLDGVNYANVANNLANGKGSLWHLTYSDTFLRHYTHQLPFMLWCEALFYLVFGDSSLIERFFCLVLLVLNSFAISKLWVISFPQYRSYFGWPLLLWIITPIIFWGFSNNVQELMMSLCAVVSITCLLRYFETSTKMYVLVGGLFCFLCGFCKGVQGLFPLAAIAIYHFTVQRKTSLKIFREQVWFTFPSLVCFLLLWIYRPARQMVKNNFQDRLQSTFVSDAQNTTSDRFNLWVDLLMELLVPVAFCALLYLIVKNLIPKIRLNWQSKSLFLFFIGLSASLPLIVTLEQRRFYLITSIPFFVVAIAGTMIPLVQSLKVSVRTFKMSNVIIIGLTVIALTYASMNHNSYKRDELLLIDVHGIGEIASDQTISADSELMFHYTLIAYLARHHNVSLSFDNRERYNYHISQKKTLDQDFRYVGESYNLYVRKSKE